MYRDFLIHLQREGGGCHGRRESGHAGPFGGGRGRFGHEGPGDRGERGFRGGGGGRERFERGFGGGGGRERLFDSGDLQLVILHLLSEEPSYGYQLIKKLEERLAGGYAPSPGVVYPTLTMLEEEGLATVETSPEGKKVYTVTEAGQGQLQESKRRLDEVLQRMDRMGQGFERGRSPQLMRAFMNLRSAVQERMGRKGVSAEELKKIVEAINAAAKSIDEL